MPSAMYHINGLNKAIGPAATFSVLWRRLVKRNKTVLAHLPRYGVDIEIEPLGSDLFVSSQIFGHKEYALDKITSDRLNAVSRKIRAAGQVPVIIDGGANVGYSAIYFAQTFPEAKVVALEPDESTFQRMKRNTSRCPQVQPVHGALWSHGNGVVLGADEGEESWSLRVGDVGVQAPSNRVKREPSIVLKDLFEQHPDWRPLIVKLDIEGAENEVVRSSPELFRTAPCIMIEPHDFKFPGAASLAPLFSALAGRSMDTLVNGENLMFIDSDLTRAAE